MLPSPVFTDTLPFSEVTVFTMSTSPVPTLTVTSLSAVTLPLPLLPTVTSPSPVVSVTVLPAVTSSPTVMSPVPVCADTSWPALMSAPTVMSPTPVFIVTLPFFASTFLPTVISPVSVCITISLTTVTSWSSEMSPCPRVSAFSVPRAVTLPVTCKSPFPAIRFTSRPDSILPSWLIMMFLPSSPSTYSLLEACSVISPSCVDVLPSMIILPFTASSVTFSFAVTVSVSGPLLPI